MGATGRGAGAAGGGGVVETLNGAGAVVTGGGGRGIEGTGSWVLGTSLGERLVSGNWGLDILLLSSSEFLVPSACSSSSCLPPFTGTGTVWKLLGIRGSEDGGSGGGGATIIGGLGTWGLGTGDWAVVETGDWVLGTGWGEGLVSKNWGLVILPLSSSELLVPSAGRGGRVVGDSYPFSAV